MAEVDIQIGRHNYRLVCGEGQESHVTSLARQVDAKFVELSQQMGGASDALVLVTTALMLQDELNEAPSKVDVLHEEPNVELKELASKIQKIKDNIISL